MGHPDGAHTHGGGSGIGTAVAVVLAAVIVASVAGPVVRAVTDLIEVVAIVLAVIIGLSLVGGAAVVAWRVYQWRANAPRVVDVITPSLPRPAESLPAPRAPELPAPERLPEVHLHLHGVSAEDVAAIISPQGIPAPPDPKE